MPYEDSDNRPDRQPDNAAESAGRRSYANEHRNHGDVREFAARAGDEAFSAGESFSDSGWNEMIESLCESKAEEFRMLGYEQVQSRDIWECVSDKYHKHGMPPLHRIVNDILSLKVTQFMNWNTMNIYKGIF